jgi:hypothetical protein
MPTLNPDTAILKKRYVLVFKYQDNHEENYCSYEDREPSREEILSALRLNYNLGVREAFVREVYRLEIA